MKSTLFAVILCVLSGAAIAQDATDYAAALRHERANVGVWAAGANGLGQRSNVSMFGAGLRLGRVMTGELGSGWRRGTFELDADLTPVYYFHWRGNREVGSGSQYSGGVTPLVMKWNFTSGKRVVPFADVFGGVLFSRDDIPPGDTANVNFISGGGGGFHYFVKPGRAWTFEGRAFHFSNASLGPHNPGINASVEFRLGYTWFKQ